MNNYTDLLSQLYADVLGDLLAEVYRPQHPDAIEGEYRVIVDGQRRPGDTIASIPHRGSNEAKSE